MVGAEVLVLDEIRRREFVTDVEVPLVEALVDQPAGDGLRCRIHALSFRYSIAVKRSYRSERRREQAAQTRERVLAAAARAFVARGFEATSVAAIAEEAGVSPETIYARFGNKRTLLT